MALAVALPAMPSVAAETEDEAELAQDVAVDVSPEPATTAPARQAVERLQRLRLHPGEDGLDVAETARRRPHLDGD
jgi:hypothetical protein